MSRPDFASEQVGMKVIMLGNEAIARGLLEAGLVIGAGYPGTPSSEILPTLAEMQKYFPHLKLEWSVNEKVGFEVAYGGSMSNVRSVAVMKHVGVNVASDAFMTACYAGARGGMVLISADDPNCYSSQNEQDNRYFGLHALVPVFEPSTPQEAKDMIKYAFDFSEEYQSLVLFRTTTRLNHGRGDVVLGNVNIQNRDTGFDWDRSRWVCLPSHSRVLRMRLLERLDDISEFADDFPFNSIQLSGERVNGVRYGFVAAGVPYSQLLDALNFYGIRKKVSILKLGLVYPPPKKLIKKLFDSCDEIVVVEELEPFIENILKQNAFEEGFSKEIKIHGKDIFPQNGEFAGEIYLENVARLMGFSYKTVPVPDSMMIIPPRLPILCPGCGHRATFYAIKQVEKKMKTKFVNSSDIGCYTLAVYKPLEGIDTEVCMGGSIGLANGIAKVQSKENPVLAILGDSTFFHSGIPALINAVFNKNNILVVILDNRSTSMTGFQDNPGTGVTITNEPGVRVVLEDLVKGCGVSADKIWVEDANDLNKTVEKLEEAVKAEGVRVFISRHLCSLLESNQFRAQQITPPTIDVNPEKCTGCLICVNKFGCQALNYDEESRKVSIEQSVCRGCKVCIDVCSQNAIYEVDA
ncbi:MAG: indolepyruvate ferredoxin oxidoreductase subunit alpha [Candidatus Lokiarchaeota archaeon]|nr:indolepyruvate ferredoxin oxidoreductase subunit alpha [Candidatus Lokiarchaeota archaeon]